LHQGQAGRRARPLSGPTRRQRLLIVLYGAGAAAYTLDRITKVLAEHHLEGRPPVQVIPHVVQLRFTTNSGGAFSILAGRPWIFFTASALACVAIVIASPRVRSAATAVGVGMILGGALGNLTDRIVRGPGISGRVIDFIDFHVWPVFNVADSAIVIGAIVVALANTRRRKQIDP
jgi:signal peptidase II